MAVVVKNACKNFGPTPVLDNLDLRVEPGTIYGLLGASGCGKTTLLSCMVGLKSLDSGDIYAFGKKPGTSGSGIPGPVVGYMPQEISLYPVFRIDELLLYYGKIFGMRPENIRMRIEFLSQFLQLSDTTRMIDTLSGGQLRRVSLAVALLHQPLLLILDEPTVGVDPVLRQSIWDHLVELVSQPNPITVIITTHYLEEAKWCDTIGVMRRGRLLCEESPFQLMTRCHVSNDSLEQAVLQLCKEDETNAEKEQTYTSYQKNLGNVNVNEICVLTNFKCYHAMPAPGDEECGAAELKGLRRFSQFNNNQGQEASMSSWSGKQMPAAGSFKSNNWDIITSLAKKNFLIQVRHPVTIGAQLLLPILQIVLYNMVMGRAPVGMEVAYVSKDWITLEGQQEPLPSHHQLLHFCQNYKNASGCFTNDMTAICTFFKQFEEKEINWVPQNSVTSALDLIHNGDAVAYIEIPQNFTFHLRDRFLLRKFAENRTIDGSSLGLKMDVSDALSTSWLANQILKRYSNFVGETAVNCGQDPRLAEVPLKFNPIYGDIDGQEWVQFMQPALILVFMSILGMLPGTIWVLEKKMGITDRGAVAGVRFGHIIGASLISDMVIILGQTAIFFFVLPVFYGMKIEGSWVLTISLVIVTALSGLSLGFLWGSFAKHETEVMMIQFFFNSLLIISTGGLWPVDAVPAWYRPFCYFLPTTIPIISMRAIMFRGWGLTHPVVLQGFGIAILWILVPFLISSIANMKKK